MDFYYQIGEFSTTTPWDRISWMKVRRFLIELRKTEIYKKYKIILFGAFLYDIKNTWDLDIRLVSDKIESYEDLENDFYKICDIAFNKHKLLVDLSFSYHDMNEGDFYKINYIKKIVGSEVTEWNSYKDNKDVIEFLTKNLVRRKSMSHSDFIKLKGSEKFNKFLKNQNKPTYYADEFLNDTDVDFFNKTNK